MTSAADVLLATLRAQGLDTIFGIPGVDNLAFYEAVDRSSFRSILVRHEATAGYAADAYFRVTGKPAVCFTTSGPGATNAMTAMGEAWASNSTFLHLTTTVASAQLPHAKPRSLPHYHPEQLRLFEPISATALHCGSADAISDLAERCLRAMEVPPHSAAFLQTPHDLLSVESAPDALQPKREERESPPFPSIDAAATLLAQAESPLLWIGSGGLGAADVAVEIAEALSAPIVITHSAKRRFSAVGHPLVVPYPPHEPAVTRLIEESDAVLVIGSDLDAMMTKQFSVRFPRNLVHIDVCRDHIGMNYPASVAVAGRAEDVLPPLRARLARASEQHGLARAARTRKAVWEDLGGDGRGPLPRRFLNALDGNVPQNAIVVCDMTVPGYWAAGYLPLAPARQLLYPIGWGTLGFGIPASIGAAVAGGGRRVISIVGDGGAMYALGELATIAEEALPITTIVVDDQGYGMLRYAGMKRFGRTFAVDLGTPDFAAVAQAFGIDTYAAQLDDPDLGSILAESVASTRPALVWLKGALVPPRMAVLNPPESTQPSERVGVGA